MKINCDEIKVGDIIWYKFFYEYKQSKVKDININLAHTPLIIMENGDSIFSDEDCFYTEKSDITDKMIDEQIYNAKDAINFWETTIMQLKYQIKKANEVVERMETFNKQ